MIFVQMIILVKVFGIMTQTQIFRCSRISKKISSAADDFQKKANAGLSVADRR
jgi:hypothetical protein